MLFQSIDTGAVAVRDRLPYWTELAEKFIAPLTIEAAEGSDFSARMYCARLRDMEIVSPCSSPARICNHEGADIGTFNLQLQHVGRSHNTTAGRTSLLNEGDFLLFDPSRPLELTFTEPTQTIVLRLPVAWSEARLPHLREMAGIPIRGDSGAGALFSNFLRSAWTQLEQGQNDWGDELADVIWPLLDMAYAAAQSGGPPEPDKRTRIRRALLDLIDMNLCEPDLDTNWLAGRLGVSSRYAQMLFADMATTPSAYIQSKRLDRAASRLKRDGRGITITEIAYDVGFNDLSSFCRAFRRRFGASPSDYRLAENRRCIMTAGMDLITGSNSH